MTLTTSVTVLGARATLVSVMGAVMIAQHWRTNGHNDVPLVWLGRDTGQGGRVPVV